MAGSSLDAGWDVELERGRRPYANQAELIISDRQPNLAWLYADMAA